LCDGSDNAARQQGQNVNEARHFASRILDRICKIDKIYMLPILLTLKIL
jgi:hypothetical protein